jgi:hypothetical protein
MKRFKLGLALENWRYLEPFSIAGQTMETCDVVVVTLEVEGKIGRGEAAGVDYLGDLPSKSMQQIEGIRDAIEAGISRQELQRTLPPAAPATRSIAPCGISRPSFPGRGCGV